MCYEFGVQIEDTRFLRNESSKINVVMSLGCGRF